MAAAASCSPPYARLGSGPFVWLDMDEGRACTAYLEQDECVLGVYRDCTSQDEREWRGGVGPGDTVELEALYLVPSISARAPLCCLGPLTLGGDWPYAQLECRVDDCRNPADDTHVGLFFAPALTPAPDGVTEDALGLPGLVTDVSGGYALAGTETAPGVYRLADRERVLRFEGGEALAVSAEGAIWVAGDGILQGPTASYAFDPSREIRGLEANADGAVLLLADAALRVGVDGALEGEVTLDDGREVALGPDGTAWLFTHDRLRAWPKDEALSAEEPASWVDQLAGAGFVDDALVWLGRCHAQVSRRHCVYLKRPGAEKIARVGLPTETSLSAWVRASSDRLWVLDGLGVVHVLGLNPLHPIPHRSFAGPFSSPHLTTRADGTPIAVGEDGRVWTLTPSPGMD